MIRQRITIIILSAVGTGLLFVAFVLAAQSWMAGEIAARDADLYLAYEWLPEPTIVPATATVPATPTPTPTPTSTPQPQPPTRLVIPAIGVNSSIRQIALASDGDPVNPRLTWPELPRDVGHDRDSVNPGESGNIIMLGHNNTAGEVFRNLKDLSPGDEIYVYTASQKFTYVVKLLDIVQAKAAGEQDRQFHAYYLGPKSEETLTLVSCWPYTTYTHRIYVVAKPVGVTNN
jgi:LPXTG-site transpeptidase (sortase) family protein